MNLTGHPIIFFILSIFSAKILRNLNNLITITIICIKYKNYYFKTSVCREKFSERKQKYYENKKNEDKMFYCTCLPVKKINMCECEKK